MPTIFSNERRREQEGVRRARKEEWLLLLRDFSVLGVNTGKAEKALALAQLIKNLTGRDLFQEGEVLLYGDPNQEIVAPRAARVAQNKAKRIAVDYRDHPHHYQTLEGQRPADLDLLLSQLVLFAGADVNGFIEQNGILQPEHKLARVFDQELPEEHFWQVREQLRQKFCFPSNGQVRVVWDLATHVINGRVHTFEDMIEIISQPVDPELLDQYLHAAWQSGLILSSNLHFAAIECLIEQGQIISSAYLPGELATKGHNLADFRQTGLKDPEAETFGYSIVANVPVHVK